MTIHLELSPESAARLSAEARAQGLPLEKLAERLLQEAHLVTVLMRSCSREKLQWAGWVAFKPSASAVSIAMEPNLTESSSREVLEDARREGFLEQAFRQLLQG